ncbi:hypothetical protein SNEBB_010304 [Seison nebaliae]|nr:hypothetical protein SNEBB_010304 [Seison nebaliae]
MEKKPSHFPSYHSCGCKGIRFCRLCDGEKVLRKLREYEERNRELKHYLYCIDCKSAHPISLDDLLIFWRKIEFETTPGEKCNFLNKQNISIRTFDCHLNFINEREEVTYQKELPANWEISQSGRAKHDYGVRVNFKKRKIRCYHCFTGLPRSVRDIFHRIKSSYPNFHAVELCNLLYQKSLGSHIEAHLDDKWIWGNRLFTINFGSSSLLTLSYPDNDENELDMRNVRIHLPLFRRSLTVISDDIRYEWWHEIHPIFVSEWRLAVTLRELSDMFIKENEMNEKKEITEFLIRNGRKFDGVPLHEMKCTHKNIESINNK